MHPAAYIPFGTDLKPPWSIWMRYRLNFSVVMIDTIAPQGAGKLSITRF